MSAVKKTKTKGVPLGTKAKKGASTGIPKGTKTVKTHRISSDKKELKDQYSDVADKLAQVAYGKPLSECLGHKETVKTLKHNLAGNRVVITLPKGDAPFKMSHYVHSIAEHLRKNGSFVKIEYKE